MQHSENSNRRILVVEDEWLIADQLADLVRELGHDVMGPASSVAKAMTILATETPDAAVLDVTLGKQKSFPIAEALIERGVPFIFLTGYVDSDMPDSFRSRTLLPKPVADNALKEALQNLWPD